MKKITMLFFVTLAGLFMGTSSYAQYCTPGATNASRHINNFSTTSGGQNISNLASGFSAGGYGDFTSMTVEQGAGGSINFVANIVGGTAGFRIWVDWNHDEVFDTTTEVAYQSNSYKSTHTGSLTVPSDAMLGATRMRIVSHYLNSAGLIDPCTTGFTNGEFEDYTFNVSTDIAFDCPDFQANIGDACDDGNPNTIDDVLNQDCDCVGIPVATNDEACTATTIACGDTIVQSLMGATESLDDSCNGSGSADVWFSFISDGSQQITVAETTSFDAVVQLFSGTACGDLVQVGACKDSPENFSVSEAGTYYFRVRPYFATGNSGTISVSLTCVDFDCPTQQANIGDACDDGDDTTINDVIDADCNCNGVAPTEGSICSNAFAVVCNAEPVTFSSATSNGTNTTTCSMGNKGLWFSFMGTGGDIVVNSTATFDHEMSINSGVCGTLTSLGCRDGSAGAESYTITGSTDGEMYYVYIAHYAANNTTTGDITINIECATPPACTAPSLALAVQDVDGNPITECLDGGSSYYVLATLSGGEGNTSYNVSANGGDEVEVNADDSVVLGPFNVGMNVNVMAVGAQDDDCDVSATATSPTICAPSNDDCAGAIALNCNETITGTTASSTPSGLSTTCGGFSSSDARDLYYSFVADGSSNYLISLDQPTGSSGLDGVLLVYSGSCGSLTNVDCSDSGNPEEVELVAPAAGTYFVRIFDYSGVAAFTLSLTCSDAPECTAPELALAVQDVNGDPITDCLEVGSDYYVLATLTGGSGNTSYNVSANGGTAVEVNADDSVVLGPFAVGTETNVTVVGAQDDDCEVSIITDSPAICGPANDDCADAIALVCGDSVAGSTVNAVPTGVGTVSCSGGTPDDVYYTLDVVADNEYTVTVNGDNYDGVLAIYSGACDSLTELYCADDGFTSGVAETITFTATADETLVIRTYDWSSSQGDFVIGVECVPLAINQNEALAGTRLFPNPLNDQTFYVSTPNLNGERLEVSIADVAGRQVYSATLEVNDSKVTVSVNDILTSGMYFVTLKHAGEANTYRLIKE